MKSCGSLTRLYYGLEISILNYCSNRVNSTLQSTSSLVSELQLFYNKIFLETHAQLRYMTRYAIITTPWIRLVQFTKAKRTVKVDY